MKQLDAIDKKIIELVKAHARIPLKTLSQEVFLSIPAVSARLEKLQEEGYIKGYHAALDWERFGYGIKAFILVSVDPKENKEFYKFAEEQECILECCHITGEYSMILKAVFASTGLLDEFLGKLQTFGKTETHVVFSTAKETY